MIPPQLMTLLQAVIIAAGNFCGIIFAYYRLDRKIDRKAEIIWRQFKASDEGKNLIEILKDTRSMLESSEAQEVLSEAKIAIAELRVLMQKFKEKMEAPMDTDGDDEPLLPKLGE